MPAASTALAPLAEYRERLPQVNRHFALFADRIEVQAHWTLGRQQHTVVALAELNPQVQRRVIRNRWFKQSVLVASLAVGTAVVLQQPDYPALAQRAAYLAWVIAGMGAVVAANTYRRRRFAIFTLPDGRTGLDLCDAGPDQARFEAFVAAIQQHIRQARK